MPQSKERHAEYMRQKRGSKLEETEDGLDRPVKAENVKTVRTGPRPKDISTDRERGLPRTNYFSDPEQKGGWVETIQRMDPHAIDALLAKIATKK